MNPVMDMDRLDALSPEKREVVKAWAEKQRLGTAMRIEFLGSWLVRATLFDFDSWRVENYSEIPTVEVAVTCAALPPWVAPGWTDD